MPENQKTGGSVSTSPGDKIKGSRRHVANPSRLNPTGSDGGVKNEKKSSGYYK